MTYEEFLAIARRFEGRTIETVTGRRFEVGIYMDCPFYKPESSGYGQSDGRWTLEQVDAEVGELPCPAGRAVPGAHLEARARRVGGHRAAHRPEPDETDARRHGRGAVVWLTPAASSKPIW